LSCDNLSNPNISQKRRHHRKCSPFIMISNKNSDWRSSRARPTGQFCVQQNRVIILLQLHRLSDKMFPIFGMHDVIHDVVSQLIGF